MVAQNLAPLANWWTPNGEISDAAPIGDTLYMIGDFRQVGPYTGNMAIVDSNMNVSTILVYDFIQKKSTKLTLPTIKTWGFNYYLVHIMVVVSSNEYYIS